MILKRRLISTMYIVAAAIGFVVAFLLVHLPHGPEHWSADLRTAFLSKRPPTQHPRIVLIEVTDATLEPYPYVSPIDRKLLADLVQAIDVAGAKTIALDVILDRPTESNKDDLLISRLRDARARVVLGILDERTLLSEKASRFQTDAVGQTNRPTGHLYFHGHDSRLVISDNVIRQLAESTNGPESFAEVIADSETTYRLPKSSYISWLLTPRDKTQNFLTLSAETVLGQGGLNLESLLRDKIVLIGGNFLDRDQHLTPLSVRSNERYSGLFINAQIVAQILDQRSVQAFSWLIHGITVVFAIIAGVLVGRSNWSKHYHPWIEIVSVAALVLLSVLAFLVVHVIFPFVSVLVAWGAGITAGHYSRHAFK